MAVEPDPLSVIVVGDKVLLSRKDGDGPTLVVSLAAWEEFLAGVRAGEFELP